MFFGFFFVKNFCFFFPVKPKYHVKSHKSSNFKKYFLFFSKNLAYSKGKTFLFLRSFHTKNTSKSLGITFFLLATFFSWEKSFQDPFIFQKKDYLFFLAFFKEFLFCGEKEKLYLSSFSTIISLYQQWKGIHSILKNKIGGTC